MSVKLETEYIHELVLHPCSATPDQCFFYPVETTETTEPGSVVFWGKKAGSVVFWFRGFLAAEGRQRKF